MGNPIFGPFGNNRPNNQSRQPQQNQQTGLFGLMNQVRNSPNPNAAMEQVIQNNPNMQDVMDYIRRNGGSAKAAFYNMAAEKGIDPNSILRLLT